MSAEVACLDISAPDGNTSSNVCAVGLWDMTAKLVNIKDMSIIHTEELGGGLLYYVFSIRKAEHNTETWLFSLIGQSHFTK